MGTAERIRRQVVAKKNDAPNQKKSARENLAKQVSTSPIARGEGGRFLPGTASPNPGGRPKGAAERAREIIDSAQVWEYLGDVANGLQDVPEALRVEVALKLIDRAHGKAVAVNVNAEVAPAQLEDLIELKELPVAETQAAFDLSRRFAELEAKRQQSRGDGPSDALLLAPTASPSTEGK